MSEQGKSPAVEIALRTDPGRDPDKQVNEDAAAYVETKHGLLAVVCDGMGGHAGGKEAAELALATIIEIVEGAPDATKPRDALRVGVEEANRRVFSMPTAESGLRPGSTVVAVLAHAAGAEIAHVGDSRVYLVHAGAVSQVTRDHSMVQELVDRNLIRAEDAASHPDANKILRALGIAAEVEVEVRPEPIGFVAGDVFVLCSDGLSDLVNAPEILEVAGTLPPAQAAGQLIDLANARGGHDNVTAMLLRMKTTASVDGVPTIAKTVQVTQEIPGAPAPPADQGSGPRGTLMAAPAAPTSGPHAGGHAPVALPSAPPASSVAHRPSRLPIFLGVALALVAIAIAAVLVWVEHRPRHVNVPLLDAGHVATTATATAEESDGAPPEITPAVPLSPPSASGAPNEPGVCAKARAARARNSPAAERLEGFCRAQGGVP